MSTLQDTDLFVVDRNGTNYKLPHNQMSTLQDTDLFVVERNGTNYKIEAVDLDLGPTGSIDTPVAVLTPLNGAGTNAGSPYEPLSTAVTAVGGATQMAYSTDTIVSVATGGNLASVSCLNDGGSSAISEIIVNGTTLTNSGAGSVTAGTFSSDGANSSFAEMFDGNPSTVSFSKSTGTATFTFTTPIAFNTLQIRGWNSNGGAQVSVNGVDVPGLLPQSNGGLSTVSVGGTDLTFATDNNLDKFEIGDVVQGSDWNQSQVWSSNLSAPGGFTDPTSWLFDANTSNLATSNNAAKATLDLSPAIPVTSIKVATGMGGSNPIDVTYTIDGVTSTGNASDTFEIGSLSGNISQITAKGTNQNGRTYLNKIYINGQTLIDPSVSDPDAASITAIDDSVPSITVDGGSWKGSDGSGDQGDGRYEPDQEWSSSTGITDSSGTRSSAYIFDGVITGSHTNGLNTHNSTITLANSVTATSSIRFYGAFENATGVRYTVNGTTTDAQPPEFSGNTTFGWASVTNVSLPVTINNVGLTDSSTTNGGRFVGIEIDGKLLVDSSVPGGAGSTDISKTVTSDATLTFTDDTELANMVGPLEMVDQNGNAKTPVTSNIASVTAITPTIYVSGGNWQSGYNAANEYTASLPVNQWVFQNGGYFINVQKSIFTSITLSHGGGDAAEHYYSDDGVNFNSMGAFTGYTIESDFGHDYYMMRSLQNGGSQGTSLLMNATSDAVDLTFQTPNADLQYFQVGDNVGTKSGFAAVTYVGNGSTSRSISSLTFSPGLVWFKNRGTANYHQLHDILRGPLERIFSNTSDAESTYTTALTSFDSNGWTMSNGAPCNASGNNYIAWCFGAGDTTVTNNDGSIATQVRSTGDFSIINWNGNGTAGTVGTGLSSVDFIISKCASQQADWAVWSSVYQNPTGYLSLNSSASLSLQPTVISGAPTNGVVPLGSNGNYNTNMIMYAWKETPGISSFGEYTGSSSNTTVVCGFKPAFVMVKSVTGVADWIIFGGDLGTNTYLKASTNDTQATNGSFEILSNGFKLTNSSGDWNASGQQYIYAAFAGDNPIEVLDVDVATNTMSLDGGDWYGADGSGDPYGETNVTGEPLIASANDVEYLDNNTLGVSGVSGNWISGLYAKGAQVTATAPSPSSIQYTSANGTPLTTAFSGTDATLSTRTWTWQESNAVTGPWTTFATRTDTPGQDGATPLANKPTLAENKFYQVKVRYDSNNADYVESTFNTFKTGTN